MLLGLGSWIAIGCGIAIGTVFGDGVRLAVWLILELGVLVAVHRCALDVTIDAHGIRLGRALLPWSAIDRVEVFDQNFRAALTTDGHPNDYRRIRSTKAGLRAWLNDPTDPHRAWVASVRDPVAVRHALGMTA